MRALRALCPGKVRISARPPGRLASYALESSPQAPNAIRAPNEWSKLGPSYGARCPKRTALFLQDGLADATCLAWEC
jgi:hypothetical protein